jgi:hypothetical protein
MIIKEQAEAIMQSFGPNSCLYECSELSEIIKDVDEAGITNFLSTQLVIESFTAAGVMNTACHQEGLGIFPQGHHKNTIKETKTFLAGIRERVVKLCKDQGWTPPDNL